MVGAVGLVAPTRFVAFARQWQSTFHLYLAAAIRLVVGSALYIAAPESRAPFVLRILGVLTIVGGLAVPFIGLTRIRRLTDWASSQPAVAVRTWAALAMALGLFLMYAVS